jgi:ABC transport system ATP-binding/permease protein
MAPPLLSLTDATILFGGRPTFTGVSLALGAGDRVCLVGRNGGGKSTILKILAGLIEPDSGKVFRQPGARVAYMPQLPVFDPDMTVGDFVATGVAGGAPDHLVGAMLSEVDMRADRTLDNLSGGESRRVSIAQVLIGDPDILLLDEPTNHLDIAAIEWLEQRLAAHRAGLLLISHDRTFLERLSTRTLWLDRGTIYEHDQGYGGFEAWSEGILEAEAAADARMDKRIAAETIWSRQGISARRKRNQGRLRRLYAMREERAQRVIQGTAKLGTATAEGGGKLVFELEDVSKSFASAEGSKVILSDFSTRILRGDRIGVIGRNGAGKSTLVGILTGAIEPDSGTIRRGTNLIVATFDQMRATLDLDSTPWETLAGGGDSVQVQQERKHVASYLRDFLFEDRQFRAKVSTLSGGERNRLLLAKVLAQPSNLLVLDEPTNDLDLETLGLLEELLADYDGTLLLVTHDRDFLDRVVTSTIAVEGDGVVHEYVGGYTDYLRQRRAPEPAKHVAAVKQKPAAAAATRSVQPARLSYKEQRDLATLPDTIATLEAEKAAIEAKLADPQHFAKDHAALAKATQRHGEIAAALEEAEHRWLELAAREEELARR